MQKLRQPERVLGAALFLGWLWNALFYAKAAGVSAPLFIGALSMLVLLLARGEGKRPSGQGWLLLGALNFFAWMIFWRASPFLSFWNGVAIWLLLAYGTQILLPGGLQHFGLLGHALLPLRALYEGLTKAAPAVGEMWRARFQKRRWMGGLESVLLGTLLALPVLTVFVLLLGSADLVFAQRLEQFFDLLSLEKFIEWVWRLVLIAIAAWLLAGGMFAALQRQGKLSWLRLPPQWDPLGRGFRWLGIVEASIVLLALDALLFSFAWIQLRYLFGGAANVHAAGFTYAEYARRGFFELVAASLLGLGLLMALGWGTRVHGPKEERLLKGASSVLVAFLWLLLASAFMRLRLYEWAYGFTELRLYSHGFMFFLAAVLGWQLITLWWRRERFLIGAWVAALAFLAAMNLLNPDAFVARQNLARYHARGDIDMAYLTALSADAVPVLVEALDDLRGAEGDELRRALRGWLEWLAQEGQEEPWPSIRWSRWRALKLLRGAGLEAQGEEN